MSYPAFHPGERARIGPYAFDRRIVGESCVIERIASPIYGEYRYGVSTDSGMYTVVLESTLERRFEKGYWRDCVWRPKREAR